MVIRLSLSHFMALISRLLCLCWWFSPEGSQISPFGFSTDAKGKLQIEILFNKPVDTSTFVPGTSNILAMETNPNATVTVKWDLNNRFLTIVTNDL